MAQTLGIIDRPARGRSASVKLSGEKILQSCEAAWTQVDAGCTVNTSATKVKRGSASASFEIAAAAAQGIQARVAPDTDNTSIAAGTHLCIWLETTAELAADDIRIGFDNTAAAGGTQRYVSVPAVSYTDEMVAICVPLVGLMTQAHLDALTSVSTVILYLQNADWEGTLHIDHIRVVTIESESDEVITVPEVSRLCNTALETDTVDVFVFPFVSRTLRMSELPVDCDLAPVMGSGESYADWDATGTVGGFDYRKASELITDIEFIGTAMICRRASDLGAADEIAIRIAERMEV